MSCPAVVLQTLDKVLQAVQAAQAAQAAQQQPGGTANVVNQSALVNRWVLLLWPCHARADEAQAAACLSYSQQQRLPY